MRPFEWRDGKARPESAKAEYILLVRLLYCGRETEVYCIAQWNGYGWVGDTGADLRAVDMDSVIEVLRWAEIPVPDEREATEKETRARRDFAVWRLGTLVGVYQGEDNNVLGKWGSQIKAQSLWGLEEALCHLGVITDAARALNEDAEPWEMLRRRITMELDGRNAHGR